VIIITLLLITAARTNALNSLTPTDGRSIYSKYVLIAWEQVSSAEFYQLQICKPNGESPFDEPEVDLFDSTHAIIVKSGLDFGNEYLWRTRAFLTTGDTSIWSETNHFQIVELPDSVRNAYEISMHMPDQVSPGIIVSSPFGVPNGFENDGEVVWFLPGETHWTNGQWALSQLPNGDWVSIHHHGIRIFNIENDTLLFLRSNPQVNIHHDVVLKSDGNFFAIKYASQWVVTDGDSLMWRSDDIIEMNPNNEIVWIWRTFDHLSLDDFDPDELATVPPRGVFDWTHSNACYFNESENAIYLSIRNLSRIVKIEYPSGNIIWQMGRDMPSGDVDFGHDLDFHRQHSPEIQEDGSLLLFDNHWILGGDNDFSRVMQIGINPDGEDQCWIEWTYDTPFARTQGDVDRLPNGNILINPGGYFHFYELTPERELVWEADPVIRVGNYRAEKVLTLFPLVYTVTTPGDSVIIPSQESWISFQINNEGELAQAFQYELIDCAGWFDDEIGLIEIPAERSANITAVGFVPNINEWNEISLIVEPVITPGVSETYSTQLFPGEPLSQGDRIQEPSQVNVLTNYPNPFNNITTFTFSLPFQEKANMRIYDVYGRLVKDLINSSQPVENWNVSWNGTDKMNAKVCSGTYFCFLTTPNRTQIRGVILIR